MIHGMLRRCALRRVPSDRRSDEGGYIMVLIAGAMTTLLAIGGLSVDLGFWYREGTKLQNAVDAAALAGVVFMPGNFSKATSTALTMMTKNEFPNGIGGVTVTVTSVAGKPRRLKVCAVDTQVEVFLTGVVGVHPKITRCSVAEYILPVAMGSPLNEMSQSTLGVWPAVNGTCSSTEDGDEIMSQYSGMFPDHTWNTYTGCTGSAQGHGNPHDPNPMYDASGYNYIVDVKSAASTPIQVYDGEWGGSFDGNQGLGATVQDTLFKVTWDHATPLDTTDDVLVVQTLVTNANAAYTNQWVNLTTVSAIGRYTVNVTVPFSQAAHGSNSFGLRALQGGSTTVCSADPNDAARYSATCPEVFGEQHLGVNAQVASSVATFFLANVDPIYAGRQMTIGLFDPGEGGLTIEVLDPNGNPVTFTYATNDNRAATLGALDYTGTTSALPVNGVLGVPPTYTRNPYTFNDRHVDVKVDLPASFAAYAGKTWWKLRYTFGGSVSDRTTWQVGISGDPVHLVLG